MQETNNESLTHAKCIQFFKIYFKSYSVLTVGVNLTLSDDTVSKQLFKTLHYFD